MQKAFPPIRWNWLYIKWWRCTVSDADNAGFNWNRQWCTSTGTMNRINPYSWAVNIPGIIGKHLWRLVFTLLSFQLWWIGRRSRGIREWSMPSPLQPNFHVKWYILETPMWYNKLQSLFVHEVFLGQLLVFKVRNFSISVIRQGTWLA